LQRVAWTRTCFMTAVLYLEGWEDPPP